MQMLTPIKAALVEQLPVFCVTLIKIVYIPWTSHVRMHKSTVGV
jgi:hypothetical protein